MDASVEVLVIGAGISGLAFGSSYLAVHPEADLLILEREETLGGTWNRRRSYDHFYTQWSVGFAEFSGYPMDNPPEQDQYCGLFKSKYTTKYLEEYAAGRTFGGRSLLERIRFSEIVTHVEKHGNGWQVDLRNSLTSQQRTIITQRLVVASGLTSVPKLPQIIGADTFEGPIVHTLDFGSSGILADPQVRHVTVVGGGKSAADMVYAGVKAGKDVAWIVRPSGTGPCIFVGAKGKGPYTNAFELASTRAPEALQPSCLASETLWTRFLHRSRLGQALSSKIWAAAHQEAIADADYDHRPSRGNFEKLAPHVPIFWRNNAAGIINHEDFYEVIADSVDIHYDEVEQITVQSIRTRSGTTIDTDALLLGTGWEDSLDYVSGPARVDLDLPYPMSWVPNLHSQQSENAHDWAERERLADVDIVVRFPVLAQPPKHVQSPVSQTPYRLYNLMVPADDRTRSFACVGLIETTNCFRTGEAQSLWVTAYFDGQLDLPPVEQRRDEIAYFVAWNRRRYLSSGNGGNSVEFDTLRYTDHLLAQLGLHSHLKNGFAYYFSPNRAEDYAKLQAEYNARYGQAEFDTKEPK